MQSPQSTQWTGVRTRLACALFVVSGAGCSSPMGATSDGASESTGQSVEAQAQQAFPPVSCLGCTHTLVSSSAGLNVTGLAVTGSALFWSGAVASSTGWQFGVFSAPLAGGTPTLLQSSPLGKPPNSVVAAGGALYWQQPGSSGSGTWTMSQLGGTATELQSIPGLVLDQRQAVAARVTEVTFLSLHLQFNTVVSGDPDNSRLWAFTSRTLAPWTTQTLLDSTSIDLTGPQPGAYYPDSVALDGSNVYFVSYRYGGSLNAVYQMSLSGGTPLTIGFADSQSPIAVYGGNVYFVSSGAIATVPVGGGTQTTFTTADQPATTFAVDGSTLYWTCTTCGTVSKRAFSGGTATTLASHEAAPEFVAVDATYVYWGATDTVRRHAK